MGEKTAPTTIAQGFNNWVGAPLAQVPYNTQEALGGEDKSLLSRAGHGAQAGFGLVPGIDDAFFAGLNSLKGAATERDIAGAQPGLAGNEYYGLGDAVTGGNEESLVTPALNLLEIPLMMFGGMKAKNLDDVLQSNLKQAEKGKNLTKLDDVLASTNQKNIKKHLDYLPKYLDELKTTLNETISKLRNRDLLAKVDPTIPSKKELQSGLNDLTSEIKSIEAEIKNISNTPNPKSSATMISSDKGIIPLEKPPQTSESIGNILDTVDDIKQGGKQADGVEGLQLGPGETPLYLTQPSKSVTVAQYKKLVKNGDNLEGVESVVVKNADEARKAVKAGVPSSNVKLVENTSKGRGVLKFPQDEAALYSKVGAEQPGVQKGFFKRTWDNIAKGSKNVIKDSGDSGKRIVGLLDESDVATNAKAGLDNKNLNDFVSKLSKEEKITLADVIEGKRIPLSDAQLDAKNAWIEINQNIRKSGLDAGLEIGEVDNYFPRHVIKDSKTIDAGTGLDRLSERRYGNLEMSRQNDLPYDKDPTVLFDYIENSWRRINDATKFGKDDRILYNLVNDIAKEGGDANQVRKYLDQILNKNQQEGFAKEFSKGARKLSTFKLNPLSALTNLTQNISTLAKTDVKTMTKTIPDIISNPKRAIDNAILAKEISPADAKRVFADIGDGSTIRKWVRLIGFTGGEKTNRIVAVNAGIEYSNKLIKQAKNGSKAAIRALDNLGFDTKNLDKIEPLLGGKSVSEATQFSTKVGELPYGWQTPFGKMVTQFKSFAYKHGGFMTDQVKNSIKELRHGNVKPLANNLIAFGIAAPIAGEIVLDIRALVTNKKRDTDFLSVERYLDNVTGASSLGLLDSFEALTGKFGAKGVVSTIGGPTVGDAYGLVKDTEDIFSGEEYRQNRAKRDLLRKIPGIGSNLANTYVPNSYVDNAYSGLFQDEKLNVGLGTKDKKIFQDLEKVDPSAANLFQKQSQKKREEEKDEGGFFNKKSDKEEVEGLFEGKSATSSSIEERMDTYTELNTIMNSDDYPQEAKDAAIKASGATKEDAEYYNLASKDQDVRLQELLPKFDKMDGEELFTELAKGRKSIGNKQLVSNKMILYLYDKDYISKDEKKALEAIKYDEIKGEFYYSKDYDGGGGSGKLTYKQALKLFKVDLPKFSTLKSISRLTSGASSTSQTGDSGEILLSNILKNRPNKNTVKSKDLWF